jgi:hypothetical protein
MNVDKEEIFLYLWKKFSNSIEDVKKLKLLEDIIDTYIDLFHGRKITKIQLLEDILNYDSEKNKKDYLYENFDQYDILLVSIGLLPKKYLFENIEHNSYERFQLIETILHKCLSNCIFENNTGEKLRNCILNELNAFVSNISLDQNVIEISPLLEDVTSTILINAKALGKILLKFGLPLAAIVYVLKYVYERGKYGDYKTLAEILEKHNEDLNTLIIKIFIHCINLEKELNKQIEPKQLIKTCEKNTYTVLSQMNRFIENCLNTHDEDICYERFQKNYKDILNVFDTLFNEKRKTSDKGGSKR